MEVIILKRVYKSSSFVVLFGQLGFLVEKQATSKRRSMLPVKKITETRLQMAYSVLQYKKLSEVLAVCL